MSEYALLKSLRKEKIDCVLAEYGPTACHCLHMIKFLGLPLIVHFFGYDAVLKETINQYGEKYKDVFDYARFVVVVSQKMRQDLMDLGCPAEKLVLTYCGPNNSFFEVKPNLTSSQFLSIGRFVDKKAPYLTLAAFKNVLQRFPEAKLIMLGDGPLLNTCKNLVNFWKIEKNVEFAGIKTPAEIVDLFENSFAFIQHSIQAENGDSEGTPVAILDAQAAGLPVVSTYHAGICDVIVHNETGLLVEEKDVDGMALNMIRLLEEDGLAQRLGAKGRQRTAELFSIDRHLKTLERIIEEACELKTTR
ncbi:MAG: glycosyltransferase [Ginsengibacter sp.]